MHFEGDKYPKGRDKVLFVDTLLKGLAQQQAQLYLGIILNALNKGLEAKVNKVILKLFKGIETFAVSLREVFSNKSLKAKAKKNLNRLI